MLVASGSRDKSIKVLSPREGYKTVFNFTDHESAIINL